MSLYEPGTKALVTTDNWFLAPDGNQYRAVFGTVKGIRTDSEVLGIKTNIRSTNWYLEIGNMVLAGCQIHYAVKTEDCHLGPVTETKTKDGVHGPVTEDCRIYNADGEAR